MAERSITHNSPTPLATTWPLSPDWSRMNTPLASPRDFPLPYRGPTFIELTTAITNRCVSSVWNFEQNPTVAGNFYPSWGAIKGGKGLDDPRETQSSQRVIIGFTSGSTVLSVALFRSVRRTKNWGGRVETLTVNFVPLIKRTRTINNVKRRTYRFSCLVNVDRYSALKGYTGCCTSACSPLVSWKQ